MAWDRLIGSVALLSSYNPCGVQQKYRVYDFMKYDQ